MIGGPYIDKILFAFEKICWHVERVILRNSFIPTSRKDPLVRNLYAIKDELFDARRRNQGQVPMTPKQQQDWKKSVERVFPNRKVGG